MTPFRSLLLNQNRIKLVRAANSNRCKKVVKTGEDLVAMNPFDLTTLLYLTKCLDKLNGDTENVHYSRMRGIVESILETGDGSSPHSSIKISNIGDDGILVGFLSFNGTQIEETEIDGKTYSIWDDIEGNKLCFE